MKQIPREKIQEICAKLDGEVAVYATVTDTGEVFAINEMQQFNSASTIKLPLLALMLRDGEQGTLDICSKRRVAPENYYGGSGLLISLDRDVELSLFDISVLMMVVSDNTATNEVIDAVGMERFNAEMQSLGFTATELNRKLGMSNPKGTNFTSAYDLGRMISAAVRGELISPYVSRTLLQVMAGQNLRKFTSRIPSTDSKRPHDPLPKVPEGKVLVASKGGTLGGVGISHDCAAFFLPDGRSYTLTVLTHTGSTIKTNAALAEISQVMYEALR